MALGDPDRGVARAAAAALSGRPTARAQGALARALEHPHETVRRAAATSLARVAGEPVPADGSGPALRAASRRISARLAAMDGAALRDAVLAGAADGPSPAPVPARKVVTAAASTPAPARTVVTAASSAPAPARVATAVMVQERAPIPAPGDSGLETAILFEVRAALRGARSRRPRRRGRRSRSRRSLRPSRPSASARHAGAARRTLVHGLGDHSMDNVRYTPKRLAQVMGATERQVLAALGKKDAYGPGDLPVLREKLKRAPEPFPPRIQLFLNFKGGTGKTSVSSSYAYRLAERGYRVLMLDLDSQGHATKCLGQEGSNFPTRCSTCSSARSPSPR